MSVHNHIESNGTGRQQIIGAAITDLNIRVAVGPDSEIDISPISIEEMRGNTLEGKTVRFKFGDRVLLLDFEDVTDLILALEWARNAASCRRLEAFPVKVVAPDSISTSAVPDWTHVIPLSVRPATGPTGRLQG